MGTAQPLRSSDPQRLGRYLLTGRLGSGGMGIVYAGVSEADGRPVAVKVIHPHLAEVADFRTRFRSEAALAARVARFSTAAVLDVDVEGEQPFLVTEFVEGPTLQQDVDDGSPLSGGALDQVAIGIVTALSAIHEAGIIHRDLKPSNVILSRFGPRVIDFGIARAADVVSGLTTGAIGSPPYMAPEQFRGETVTPATDVYAWGAVVCFAGTGRPPFGVGAPEVMLFRTLEVEPDLSGLEPTLRALTAAALRKDPGSRPSTRELLNALTLGRPDALPAPPPRGAGAGPLGERALGPGARGGSPPRGAGATTVQIDGPGPHPAAVPPVRTTPPAPPVGIPAAADPAGAAPTPGATPPGATPPGGPPAGPPHAEDPHAEAGSPDARGASSDGVVAVGSPSASAGATPPGESLSGATPVSPGPAGAATGSSAMGAPGSGTAVMPAAVSSRTSGKRRLAIRTGVAALALAVAAGAAVVWNGWPGPTDRTADPVPSPLPDLTVRQVAADDDAKGPAPAVAGARRGGTADVYAAARYWELDPIQNHFGDGMMASSRLLARTLTTYREDGVNPPTLVGDLATDTGRSTDGGRTWEFTIREGVKFADGTPVTAADVARGIARSFSPRATGSTYLQRWLTGRTDYRSVYAGPSSEAPYPNGVEVPDARTLRLSFGAPHPDLAAMATLPVTAAVPAGWAPTAGDPVPVTGPYRVDDVGSSLTLVRNPQWDANTDPVRTDYPDRYVVHFGVNRLAATELMMGTSRPRGIQMSTVDASLTSEVYRLGLSGRLVDGYGPGHRDLCFNTQRVSDRRRRQALSLAFNRDSALAALGGNYVGEPTNSLLSPRIPGYQEGPSRTQRSGNPGAAMAALDGAQVTLTLAYKTGIEGERFAAAVQAAFARARVTIVARPVEIDDYLAAVGRRDNPYDLYLCEWNPDYLDGNAMLPYLYSSRGIRDSASTNVSYLNLPSIDAALDRIGRMPDRAKAALAYRAMAGQIEQYTPAIPFFDQRRLALYGEDVHELFVSSLWAVPDLSRVWVS
ncbi:ABC transporter substrate-binding protein [Cryptosporangium sp. NPDC051539]|uniref:ABC transporter substrate-binding protein n=1 Tax=Cryptosporangium sp. NPDC051539 TaxID=3363962 RepID=UPI0037927D0F